MRCVKSVAVVMVALFVSASAIARADIIGPKITISGVTVNQTANGGDAFVIENLINDSHMSGTDLELQTPSTETSVGGMWRQGTWGSSGNTVAASRITFDLGSAKDVGGMKVWNYSECYVGDPVYTKWGVKDFTLWKSSDNVSYTQVGSTYTLTKDDGLANYGHDEFSLTGVNAQYLRMNLVNSYASTETDYHYGMGEVRFYLIPEPGTLVLLGCGLIGLLAYAWRKRK